MTATFATRTAAAADARDQARLAASAGWTSFPVDLPSCIRLRLEHYDAAHTVLVTYVELQGGRYERSTTATVWDDNATTATHLRPAESTALVDLLVCDLDHEQLTQLCGRAAA